MGLVCERTVRALICSGSEELRVTLRSMLRRWACSACVRLTVETADRLLLGKRPEAELLFLDMDSVELPEQGAPLWAGLIVISRDAGRAIHSYRWHPAALLKPDCDEKKLVSALNACERHWQRGRVCLDSPQQRRQFRLPLGRIRFVEADAHYCLFDQGKQPIRMRVGTNELEELLPKPPFIRCHRSYLVHLDAVESMTYTALSLKNGGSLPLGRTYVNAVREALEAWREGGKGNEDLRTDL